MTDIFTISSELVDQLVEHHPELSTALGAPGRDHLWSDTSPDGFVQTRAVWAEALDQAQSCEVSGRQEEVAKAVLVTEAEKEIRSIDTGRHLHDLNNIASPWQTLRDVFDSMPDRTAEGWENIITRLRTIGQPLEGYRQCLERGRTQGMVVARRQVAAAIDQGRLASGPSSGFDVLLRRFDASQSADASLSDDLRSELEIAIAHAKSAYVSVTDWLETTYLPDAPSTDGVGRDRYIEAAERFLGESIDTEELYRWGWSEIERLNARLAELCARIDVDASPAAVLDRLHTDPAYGASSEDEFIQVMGDRQQRALAALDGSHFDVPEPIRQIDVKAAPPGGALAPYYSPPSEDFTRPGCVWYPMGDRTFFPLYEAVTTAYHEGFPGHHLQVGWQAAMGDELSRFHRLLVWYPGSGEGWALYAEHLMGELGFLEETSYEIGLVTSQLFRSSRVVIDIGLHCELAIPEDQPFHPGESWTFELATELLRETAFLDPSFAESEATRYAGWPGQAISYKVGERAILDLRDELSRSPDFDLKQFHADLLSVGSIGLDLMRELVQTA